VSRAVELVIVRAISMTHGAAQLGVSPNGAVFTTYVNGHSINRPRIDTGLSPLLEEGADIFNHRRGGPGGPFYERDGSFFMADGKTTFLHLDPQRSRGLIGDLLRP
jgi:hypothetical protein